MVRMGSDGGEVCIMRSLDRRRNVSSGGGLCFEGDACIQAIRCTPDLCGITLCPTFL